MFANSLSVKYSGITPTYQEEDCFLKRTTKYINDMSFIWYILIGIVAGYLAGKIMRGGGFGLIINLLLGIIGGVVGGWVFSMFGISAIGLIGSLITATIGAVIVLWLASVFSRPRGD